MRHVLLWLLLLVTSADAKDLGQWEKGDPVIRQWYRGLILRSHAATRPTHIGATTCGSGMAARFAGLRILVQMSH
jgi:hypothetical protein